LTGRFVKTDGMIGMRNIGIRVSPTEVVFAILDTERPAVLNFEQIKIPSAFAMPDALKYVRNNILDVLREYKISKAGIRVTESNAQRLSIERIQIEGVIQEAFASSELDAYYIGQISSISAKVGIVRADFKKYISGELNFDRVEKWSLFTDKEKEAVFCALGAEHA
jgi:septum formation topological specificity factor MinE